MGYYDVYFGIQLGLGLLLALPSHRRSGLVLGDIGQWARPTFLVCGVPLLVAALAILMLPENPFAGSSASAWLTSPLAQDLVFIGYLYGRCEPVFPEYLHRRIPMRTALPITGLFFAGHHAIYFFDPSASTGFVIFQLFYTFLGFVVIGLSRQWTGSILYFTLNHIAVNWIACTH
jgi:membrane protease YdiL (CAAX protease family)